MGSGNKSSPRATPRGGYTAKGELKLPDGSKIEFDGDLKYYGNDKTVKGAVRQSIEAWETKRAKAKIEYAYSVDANGNMIDRERKGGKGSVRASYPMHNTPGATFTHIHPREDGVLGGTFSTADLNNFARFANTTVRAKAKEGTYSISKGKNFDAIGFMSYVKQADYSANKDYKSKMKVLNKQYRESSISYDEYYKKSAKEFNTMLVNLHNAYKQGEKQYGYTYTLERAK